MKNKSDKPDSRDWMTPGEVDAINHPQQPPVQSKLSRMAIASLVLGLIGLKFFPILPGVLGIIFGIFAIRKINGSGGAISGTGLAMGGLVTSVVGVIVGLIIFVQAMSEAKNYAHRLKSLNNMIQLHRAFNAFSEDNDGLLPWQLEAKDEATQGGGVSGWSAETSTLFAHPAIRESLVTAKVLMSPLDPGRRRVNDGINLATVTLATGVDNGGHSYGVVNGAGGAGTGADLSRPNTILIVTRNISGPANNEDSLSDQGGNPAKSTASSFAIWKGADEHPKDARVMAGLNANEGQLLLAEGSAHESTNQGVDFFSRSLQQQTQAHHGELTGHKEWYKGSPSGFLDTPND